MVRCWDGRAAATHDAPVAVPLVPVHSSETWSSPGMMAQELLASAVRVKAWFSVVSSHDSALITKVTWGGFVRSRKGV